ncbi:putative methyltransferase family protein [Citrus sinensis]|uniref:Methyltransferase family protein n=1 Tax=Citrus sinensis TaxID=2711 RepID=A0ACB8MX63_CITSI|nr:putative methyltransferase family protein [Citrus sinensis]
MNREEDGGDEVVCLDESFFINDDYQLTTFTFGSQVLHLFCLQSASRQLVWPGAMLMNDYLSKNPDVLQASSILELGSGVGVTGILCSRFCREVLLTDHNEEVLKILKKNIEHHTSSENPNSDAGLAVAKLEWGNSDQINKIIQKYPVEQFLRLKGRGQCKFILAYVSRAKSMDSMVLNEATRHGLLINEIVGTRSVVGNLEGVIFEVTLK